MALSALILLLFGQAADQPSVPVRSGRLPPVSSVKGNVCNLAVVRGVSGSRLSVRAGPALKFRRLDALRVGERVYTCNGRGEWLGVAFSRPGASCAGGGDDGLEVTLTRSCRLGWVHRRWIEILSG